MYTRINKLRHLFLRNKLEIGTQVNIYGYKGKIVEITSAGIEVKTRTENLPISICLIKKLDTIEWLKEIVDEKDKT